MNTINAVEYYLDSIRLGFSGLKHLQMLDNRVVVSELAIIADTIPQFGAVNCQNCKIENLREEGGYCEPCYDRRPDACAACGKTFDESMEGNCGVCFEGAADNCEECKGREALDNAAATEGEAWQP